MRRLFIILALPASVALTSGEARAQPPGGPGSEPIASPFQPVIDVGIGPLTRSEPFPDDFVGEPFIVCNSSGCPRLTNIRLGPHPEGPFGASAVGAGTGGAGGPGAAAD